MSFAHGVIPHGAPVGADDELTLTVGNQVLSGWQRVAVTRALGAIPSNFELEVTEHDPTGPSISVEPGEPCTVKIGGDLVMTGYVDRYAASINPAQHTINISGRSKSEDLVDCSAIVGDSSQPGFQVMNGTAFSIAKTLANPYGVTVQSTAGDGPTIPQFNVLLGESPWDIIDRITKYSQMIVHDMPDGSVMLAKVGTDSMGSGFLIGPRGNVEGASVLLSMDERFSEYEGHLTSVLVFGTEAGVNTPTVGEIIRDDGVKRFRKRYVISEQFIMGHEIVKERAVWEMNRRKGRSYQFNVLCDSWRDATGKLWEVNKLAPISAPVLKLRDKSFLIGAVTYRRDENGQHGELALMPPEAFFVEPAGPLGLVTVEDVENFNAAKKGGQ